MTSYDPRSVQPGKVSDLLCLWTGQTQFVEGQYLAGYLHQLGHGHVVIDNGLRPGTLGIGE